MANFSFKQSVKRCLSVFLIFLLGLTLSSLANGQGLIMPGAGAANRAMAGASTAAPLDAAGAMYWNPAAISGLPCNEVYFGADMVYANTNLGIRNVPSPSTNFSESGLAAAPTIAMVYHREDSPMTLGLGVFTLVGGSVNFPSPRQPPLSTSTNQYAAAFGLLITPTVSMQLTDRLAFGAGPTITVFSLSLDPAFFAQDEAPDYFPAATHGRPYWGGGFRAGLYYTTDCCWSFGLSYLSPQWLETNTWNGLNEADQPITITLQNRLPGIVSLGTAYRGFDRTVIAMDVRYFDYANSAPYGKAVANGGMGWRSIVSMALGFERQMTERLKLRGGYLFCENPVPDVLTLFNTELPAVTKHQLSVGMSMQLTPAIAMDFAWVHAFENQITGPLLPSSNPPPGLENSIIDLSQSLDSWVFGFSIKY